MADRRLQLSNKEIGNPVKNILRRLRGALGNALVWGAVWFVGTFVLYVGLIVLAGNGRPIAADVQWIFLKICGIHAVVGFITGGAFSAYVAGTFRGRRIEDLSPARFALGGALIAIPIRIPFRIWLRFESGRGMLPLHEVTRPMVIASVFGGLTGYGTAKLAQKAMGPGESQDELKPGTERLLSQT